MNMDDGSLDRLIRAIPTRVGGFVRPEDVVVRRHLLGTATAPDRHKIREALDQSADFRKELLELAEAVDLAISHGLNEGEGADRPDFRRLPEWVRAAVSAEADRTTSQEPARRIARVSHSLWDRLRLPVTGPILVAALLVLLLVSRSPHRVSGIESWDLLSPAVEKEELISMSTRSGGETTEQTFTSARDAAVAAFRSALKFQNGEFAFRESVPDSTPSSSAELVTTDIAAPDGSRLASLRWALPVADHPQVWILSLPQRSLRYREFGAGMNSISWDPAWGRRICVTWVYLEHSHFRTGQVYTLEF